MSAPTQRRPPHVMRFQTANAKWKAQWDSVLSWSIMLAVAIHAAAFAFWPGWENADALLDSDLELLGTAWMELYAPPETAGGGAGGISLSSLAMLEEPDSLPPEVDAGLGAGLGSSLEALAALPARLRERLAGRNGPVPTIVRFASGPGAPGFGADPRYTVEDDEEEDEDDALTAEDPVNEELALLLETSPLDLSRLSAVRPQVVLPGTSAWILIRNPAEVDQYMIGSFERLDSEEEGLVDVAVWIDEWGSVEWAEISKSSGLEEMDEIALALFNEVASFRPARDRGVRVSMSAIFSVPFPW